MIEFLLIAVSDAGYADAFPDEFAKSGKLVLRPWGKIEGEVRIGGRPGTDQQVEFQPACFSAGDGPTTSPTATPTMTDQRGRFAFDRVVPGPGTVWRAVANAATPLGIPAWGWQEPVEVKPGQTARVRIGGKGRPVIGRVVVDGKPEPPVGLDEEPAGGDPAFREELKDSLDWRRFACGPRQGRPVPHRGCPARASMCWKSP